MSVSSEINNLQSETVQNIIDVLLKQNEVLLQAPTGSGKTYMIGKLMNDLLTADPNIVFIISTRSNGGLGKQNHKKFIDYRRDAGFTLLNPYLISASDDGNSEARPTIPVTYNAYTIEAGKLTASSILIKTGSFKDFLNRLTDKRVCGGEEKKIYLIIDEAHVETSMLNSIMPEYATKTIRMTATPEKGQSVDVLIPESKAMDVKLIKRVEEMPTRSSNSIEEEFPSVIKKFREVKSEYAKRKFGVNPCLIVQISNQSKGDMELNKIKSILDEPNNQDLTWLTIMQDGQGRITKCDTNDTIQRANLTAEQIKDYVKTDNSTIDIIIFKLVINIGWDIPRACMLYQARETTSWSLDTQTIGRIRRNPVLTRMDAYNEIDLQYALTAWVWGNYHKEHVRIVPFNSVITDNEIRVRTTILDFVPPQAPSFDIEKCLKITPKDEEVSWFDLYKKYKQLNPIVKQKCDQYADTLDKWMLCMLNIETIKRKYSEAQCDYKKTMRLNVDADGKPIEQTLQLYSEFPSDGCGYLLEVNDWLWVRMDEDGNFTFDSEAEREWAERLYKLSHQRTTFGGYIKSHDEIKNEEIESTNFFWGKNYLINSKICYAYYLDGKHESYPDFIMKDWKNRIHIFETKSINQSSKIQMENPGQYNEKIEELERCYQQASYLTGHLFYIPKKVGADWKIICFEKGVRKEFLTFEEFKNSLK